MTTDLTVNEVIDSLSGFDEIAIKIYFKQPVHALFNADSMQGCRALVFVMERRAGLSDQDAYNAAQTYSTREINGYFATDEIDLDSSETESGKDEPQPEPKPEP